MIGVFDSGSGGLSVLKALRQKLPQADVVYFGDIKNAPYGLKTQAELSVLTSNAVALLQNEGADHIVSACNSVAASLVISLDDRISSAPNNMIEMVGPTVAHFRGSTKRLALCATPATIASGIYQNAFKMISKEVRYIPIPELAGAIEFGKSEKEIEDIIKQIFADVHVFDTLILACTHYPLVKEIFSKVLPQVEVFDPSMTVAERTVGAFLEEKNGTGKIRFIISQDSDNFRLLVNRFFSDTDYHIEVKE